MSVGQSKWIRILPGVLLCLGIMALSLIASQWLGIFILYMQGLDTSGSSPISSILVAIVIGLIIRNLLGLKEIFAEGVSFSIKILLKLGIILLGIRLSIFDVLTLGAWGLPIIILSVLTGLSVTLWITNKMRQPHRLGTLTAVGTGICGVTAIVGTSPGIRANDSEVAYSIANITLFGIIAMFAYPYLAYLLFENDPIRAGLFLGTAIHETAQVAGASLIYDQVYNNPTVVDVATITKLTRNVLLVAVVPIMSYYYLKSSQRQASSQSKVPKWYNLVPLFVLGFLGMAVLRSVGDAGVSSQGEAFGLLSPGQWESVWQSVNTFGASYILGIAMAAVGLSTSFSVFKGFGIKPFYIGLVAAFSVTVVSLLLVYLLGGLIQF
ncbi:YeiH family protein [Bacillus sp. FJAT-44742]|uniref:YeiH family protein n=1 Tax=Bacillus sp. FJAT-44742 TaxID=2014005 RepID=UPI000C2454FA|nr:putative sulfate exporter family transporter [Bacillus sp. FJAT-44742]